MTVQTEMSNLTDYAKSSDNFLAHRYFKRRIFNPLPKGESLRISWIYLDCFEHFAISRKFIDEMVQAYVDAGLVELSQDKKEVIKLD